MQEYSLVCTCDNFTWWIVGILFYKGALLSFGLFLAFETRHAYPEVNDSYNIGFSVYNVTVFSVIGSITAFALRKYNQEFTHGIIGASITICTTVTLGLIFLPRVSLHGYTVMFKYQLSKLFFTLSDLGGAIHPPFYIFVFTLLYM